MFVQLFLSFEVESFYCTYELGVSLHLEGRFVLIVEKNCPTLVKESVKEKSVQKRVYAVLGVVGCSTNPNDKWLNKYIGGIFFLLLFRAPSF